MFRTRIPFYVLVVLTFVLMADRTSAQSLADFYKGKVVTVVAYTPPGSAYDLSARLLARHLPKHIPGEPTAIVKNMPGAGGLTATRYLYFTAPKDGTVLGTIGRGLPFEP